MDFTLTEQNGDEFQFSLKITKAEAAALDGAALTALWGQIRQLTGANRTESETAEKKEPVSTAETFVAEGYKGICVKAAELTDETERANLPEDQFGQSALYELLLDKLIEVNDIPIPKDLDDEIQVVYNGALNSLKYQRMFGENPDEMNVPDQDALYEQIAVDVTREYKENLLLKSIIKQEGIDCTPAELEAEALAMAEREDCSLDMIKKFMGEDYGFLKGDLLKKKAMQLLCDSAVVLPDSPA